MWMTALGLCFAALIEWTWAAPQSAARATIGIMCSAGDKRGDASTSVQVE